MAKPSSSMAHVAGSGTAGVLTVPRKFRLKCDPTPGSNCERAIPPNEPLAFAYSPVPPRMGAVGQRELASL